MAIKFTSDKFFQVAVDIDPASLNITHHGKPSEVTHSSEAYISFMVKIYINQFSEAYSIHLYFV